jgi:hypothetical protein
MITEMLTYKTKPGCPERKAVVRASPIVFGPRIPDFLSRLMALSNIMRLSLRESRMRGRG